jgi:hypothetical protein
MTTTTRPAAPPIRSAARLLHAAIAACLCLAPVAALAMPLTWAVTSCDEGSSGDLATRTGTLRFAAANAASGDRIDMTSLACAQISLTTGAIQIPQDNLRIDGPGIADLIITGKYEQDRIFRHTGTGTLQISDLSMSAGYLAVTSGSARGGCLFTAGSAILDGVRALYCTAKSPSRAAGGGIYATTGLSLKGGSVVSRNTGDGETGGDAYGGGVFVKTGSLLVEYSTVADNQLLSVNEFCLGGGIAAQGSATIKHSTVSGNYSCWSAGGVSADGGLQYGANTLSIGSSTISGNVARFYIGGLFANSGTVDIRNATVTGNESGFGFIQQTRAGTGVHLVEKSPTTTTTIDSSIIADNVFGTTENDLELSDFQATFNGGHNLIGWSSDVLPPDTISGACPNLGRLRDNGGLTATPPLLSGCAAIDAGAGNLQDYDQRGWGFVNKTRDYPRASGAVADAGAYELQQSDTVFSAAFDGCVALP